MLCVMCKADKRSALALPCGHLLYCASCMAHLPQQQRQLRQVWVHDHWGAQCFAVRVCSAISLAVSFLPRDFGSQLHLFQVLTGSCIFASVRRL